MRAPIVRGRGFTLIELAIAVFIIGLLLGSILVPLTTQVEQKQIGDTQKTLDEISEALVGFALANGYLPCPDTDNDGNENVDTTTGYCSPSPVGNIAGGNLPWATIGIANADVWGNRFRYIVREEFARRTPATSFSFSTTANVRVCQSSAACSSTALTSTAVASVFSAGKNGYGATNSLTGTANTSPSSADEIENTNNDRNVVSRTISPSGSSAGEFDDIVTWLSKYTLFNRMVAAGKLP